MKNIKKNISNGEGITVEFKKSRGKVTADVYQSICAFLNRNGGQVILGVEDDGAITGIKEDALLRVDNVDRYNDRDDIRTNLIESYDRLMGFVAKHLPDKFYLIGDQRVSLRDKIFREVATNCLIHREFLNPFPAKFVIEKDRVYTENANKPHGHGLIDPTGFTPFPKNPVIARVFKKIGRADELGSGVKNLFTFTKEYSGALPQLVEDDIFRAVIPLTEQVNRRKKIINFCKTPRSTSEIMTHLGLKHREHFRSKILQPLLDEGILNLTIPDIPKSPKQKYYS
ncbi:MAG: putative DNA binding domain-containing protein [Desulfobacula sp.]|uniref:Fic family protein n=1 Tax=Desulfobacula sp. TaxID=2593537 RepID=UPI0025BFD9E4|nr:RNA-binding domain-containing protein [Desulfobacula sp.]MCD4723137.1 putative DNA binding domain-containing protein [Desulfobacula sp.]